MTTEIVDNDWLDVYEMFKYFKPYKIDNSDPRFSIFYGYSDLFEELLEGEEIPFYHCEIFRDYEKNLIINFKKV